MRFIYRSVLLAVVASLAMSAVTVASSSASEFVFSKTGELKGEALRRQLFNFPAVGNFACAEAPISGSVSVLKTKTQIVTVKYKECFYFGIPMTATPAEYELNAAGTIKLLKTITLKAGSNCKITVPAQTPSGGATYRNEPGHKVAIELRITGLESQGVGAACEYASEHKGVLEGSSLIELVGGSMEVI